MYLLKKEIFFSVIMVTLFCHCENQGIYLKSPTTNQLLAADLKLYFSQIHVSATNILFSFHNQGVRYKYVIGNGLPSVNKYGETICLATNQNMRLVSHGVSLVLEGYSDGVETGFVVTSKRDFRSFGCGIETKKAKWVIASKSRKINAEEGCFNMP